MGYGVEVPEADGVIGEEFFHRLGGKLGVVQDFLDGEGGEAVEMGVVGADDDAVGADFLLQEGEVVGFLRLEADEQLVAEVVAGVFVAGGGDGVGHDFVVLFEPVHVEGEPAAALFYPGYFQFGESVQDAAGDEADDGEGGVYAHEEVLEELVVESAHADGLVELLVDGDGHSETLAFFKDGPELFLVGPLALELAGDVGAAKAKVCGAAEFLDGHVDVVEG